MLQLAFLNFRKDSYILVEGKIESDRFYIIQSGKVRCSREMTISEAGPAFLGPGDFIGVIPCMAGRSQIETVIAVTDVVVISVRRDQYPELIEKNAPVALKIIKTFASRMRSLNEVLTKLTLKNNAIVSPEQLFDTAIFYEKNGKLNQAIYSYYQYLKECPQGSHAAVAKSRFVTLKPHTNAVYFEPKATDLIRNYPKETMIFCECQTGQDMFIIQEGRVSISKVVNGNEVVLAVLKKGDFFGEMALLENKPRSASAYAHEDCRLMAVNRQNFDQMVSTQPQLIARLTTTLAERIWSMNRQLANTTILDPVSKLLDMLALQIEKAKITASVNQFDLSPIDLANMCGITSEQQRSCIEAFLKDPRIKLINDKIYVSDCQDIVKSASYYRKQR